MWQLDNHTPYAVARGFARDRCGAELWIVAVKATFVIWEDGASELAKNQEPVTIAPSYLGAPGRSSLRADTELLFTKPGTDVLLHGQAWAPEGKPVRKVEVELRCGPVRKQLAVFGERTYRRRAAGIVPSEPEPFTSMPICYERAFGGADPMDGSLLDPRNPVGTGFALRGEHLVDRSVPNIELPDAPIVSGSDQPKPAGFGPLGRSWTPRLGCAGTYDAAWRQERMPLLPADFSDRFFYSAPVDQQVAGYLPAGALVELRHLTKEGLLRFSLPKIYPCLRTSFGLYAVEHRTKLHTVFIDAEARTVSMVWCSALPCQGIEHRLECTRITEKTYV